MHQKAHVISKLAGEKNPGTHFEPHGTLQHVAHFPHQGVICLLKLGAAGLQYQRGEHLAVLPTEELIALFEKLHPEFAEKPNAAAPEGV